MASFLEQQLPEFDVRAAPGGADPSLEAAVEEKAVLPTTIAPAITGKSPSTPVDATGKPSTLEEAFIQYEFPDELRDPLLNMVGAERSSDPAVLAAVPFEVFRSAVADDLVLEDGEAPTLFQKGRFFKFFKDLLKSCSAGVPSSSSSPSAPPPSAPPIVLEVPNTAHRHQIRDFIDQTAGPESFELLTEEEIAQIRSNYFHAHRWTS